MTTPRKEKPAAAAEAAKGAAAVTELEGLLESMERRVEGLGTRIRDLASENARLKGALLETIAERDRLKAEVTEARDGAANAADYAERLSRLTAEREEVRRRIERLVKSLEETDEVTRPAEG